MLKLIPPILSPQLLVALHEMGHGDQIVLADRNFPGRRIARAGGACFLRADGLDMLPLMEAILTLLPLDPYVETSVWLMERVSRDEGRDIPIWSEYRRIIREYGEHGDDAMGYLERFAFYEQAQTACCVVQTGESSPYANVILQKG